MAAPRAFSCLAVFRPGVRTCLVAALLSSLALPQSASAASCLGNGNQWRITGELVKVGRALLAWRADQVEEGTSFGCSEDFDATLYPLATHAEVVAALVPTYLKSVPMRDRREMPYEFRVNFANPASPQFAMIRSKGSFPSFEGNVYTPRINTRADQDWVWADGISVTRPPSIDPEKDTEAAIADIASAMQAWLVDQTENSLVQTSLAQPPTEGNPLFDLSTYSPITSTALCSLLVDGGYTPFLLLQDAWGNPFEFWLDTVTPSGPQAAAIRSLGSDGVASGNTYIPGTHSATDVGGDAVWADGMTVRRYFGNPLTATMEEVRWIGNAMMVWLSDQVRMPIPEVGPQLDLTPFSPITPGDLADLLVPDYLPFLPEMDGWGQPYEFWLDTADPLGAEAVAIRSSGAEGLVSGATYTPGGFPLHLPESDIVWAEGLFFRFPESVSEILFIDGFEAGGFGPWVCVCPPGGGS